jgi:hypothetical protein
VRNSTRWEIGAGGGAPATFLGSDAARVGKSEVVVRGEAGLGLALYRAERVGEEVAKAVEARSVVTSIKARWGGHFGR